jgi:hypothetical protein
MLNFRVRDLDKMAAQLQAAGIEVKIDPQSYPNGWFARVHDPEGNPIELCRGLWREKHRSLSIALYIFAMPSTPRTSVLVATDTSACSHSGAKWP